MQLVSQAPAVEDTRAPRTGKNLPSDGITGLG